MVMATTFVAPPWLKMLLKDRSEDSSKVREYMGIDELVNDP